MTSFSARAAQHFFLIKAAKELRKEIEKAGLDNLKILAGTGISIVGTYLQGCSPQEKARIRRDFNAVLEMGITADMVLTELGRQIPELALIMGGKQGYKKTELQNLEQFLKET
ncbi:hypothetical protein ES703_107113 [subsurface metagenome]